MGKLEECPSIAKDFESAAGGLKVEPRLFVGSSVDSLDVAYAIQENVDDDAKINVWPQGVFDPSQSAVESLLNTLTRMDFGIFVFTPDDVVTISGEDKRATRDNILFELGLFIGKLGKERAFIFVPRECEDLHLPTDLLGMTPVTSSVQGVSDEDLVAATGAACNRVRKAIRSSGRVTPASSLPSTPLQCTEAGEQEALEGGPETAAADRKEAMASASWLQSITTGQYEEAIELLEKEIEATDDESKVHYLQTQIGKVKAQIDLNSGIQYLEELITAKSTSYTEYLGLSNLYEENQLYDEALTVLNRGLEHATVKYHIEATKATVLSIVKNDEEAQEILERIVKEQPGYAYARVKLAQILYKADQGTQAKSVYQDGLRTLPNDDYLLLNYGLLLSDLGENAAALAVFRKLHILQPNSADHLGRMANFYYLLNLDGLALEAYEQAIELDEEESAWLFANLGNLYAYKGLNPKAIDLLNRALKQDPTYAFAHERLSAAIQQNDEEHRKAAEIISSQA